VPRATRRAQLRVLRRRAVEHWRPRRALATPRREALRDANPQLATDRVGRAARGASTVDGDSMAIARCHLPYPGPAHATRRGVRRVDPSPAFAGAATPRHRRGVGAILRPTGRSCSMALTPTTIVQRVGRLQCARSAGPGGYAPRIPVPSRCTAEYAEPPPDGARSCSTVLCSIHDGTSGPVAQDLLVFGSFDRQVWAAMSGRPGDTDRGDPGPIAGVCCGEAHAPHARWPVADLVVSLAWRTATGRHNSATTGCADGASCCAPSASAASGPDPAANPRGSEAVRPRLLAAIRSPSPGSSRAGPRTATASGGPPGPGSTRVRQGALALSRRLRAVDSRRLDTPAVPSHAAARRSREQLRAVCARIPRRNVSERRVTVRPSPATPVLLVEIYRPTIRFRVNPRSSA